MGMIRSGSAPRGKQIAPTGRTAFETRRLFDSCPLDPTEISSESSTPSNSDEAPPPKSLTEVLDRIESAAEDNDPVSLGDLLDAVGRRSFAPLLMIPGLVMALPGPGDIPGVPAILGTLVVIIVSQMWCGRDHVWVPGWFERRSVSSGTVRTALDWGRRPAGWVDRVTRERLTGWINSATVSVLAVACLVLALGTPLMEVVPMSANVAGLAITMFALSLVARDGLLAIIAIVLTVTTTAIVGWSFLG